MTPHSHTLEPSWLPLPLVPEPPPFVAPLPGACVYFKRFKMLADLANLTPPPTPPGCSWSGWSMELLEAHADTLFQSFRGEIDAQVFASLGDRDGCRNLMSSIAYRTGFIPAATWLLLCEGTPVGSVQGLRERRGVGAIQNVGILPGRRGQGLGEVLVRQAMYGFAQVGLTQVSLEVTAVNERALRLYRRLGFRRIKTLYKQVTGSGPCNRPTLEGL